jgi:hypothetical protein
MTVLSILRYESRDTSGLGKSTVRASSRAALTGAVLAGGLLTVLACSSSSSSSDYDGPPTTECSNGPPYDARNYPPPAASSTGESNLPACVPRCGAEQKFSGAPYGTLYAIAALPSGQCGNDRERCSMTAAVVSTCRGETRPCDLSFFECTCTEGAWRCFVTSQGAGACGPCTELDASTASDGDASSKN